MVEDRHSGAGNGMGGRDGGGRAARSGASDAFVASVLSGVPDEDIFLGAQVMSEGREASLHLHGGRRMSVVGLLARPIRHLAKLMLGDGPDADLGDQGSEIASRVAVALAVREIVPDRVRMMALDGPKTDALLAMTASVDGDEFYLAPPDGTGVMVRPIPIRVPHGAVMDVAAALEIGHSSWAEPGLFQVVPRLAPETDTWEYPLIPVARWGAYSRPGMGQIAPATLGCDRLTGQIYLLAAGSEHALRQQAETDGVVEKDQVLILLVLSPDPSDVMQIHGGPAANNALSANPEKEWDASVSPLSHDSMSIGAKALEAYVASGGRLEDVEASLSGVFSLLVLSLECLTAQMWSGVVVRQHAEHVAEWVMQSLATIDPEHGGKIVRQVALWRDQGRDMAIHGTITDHGTFRVVVNEVDANGSKLNEGVLIPG